MAKRKPVNFEIIRAADSEPYAVLADMMRFHAGLSKAAIALAWRKQLKSDKDGHLVLGKCVKVSGLHRELADFDFVIVLNREMWDQFSLEQKKALVDHELCHAAPDDDEDGMQKRDEKNRLLWRMRKHDIEEFTEIIQRHGCYKRDLESFAKAIKRRDEAPLFEAPPMETAVLTETAGEGDGAPLASAAVMGGTHQKGARKKARTEPVN